MSSRPDAADTGFDAARSIVAGFLAGAIISLYFIVLCVILPTITRIEREQHHIENMLENRP